MKVLSSVMLGVPTPMVWKVTLFLQETSKSLGPATVVHCASASTPGKRGTVSKPKEGKVKRPGNGIACVKQLH